MGWGGKKGAGGDVVLESRHLIGLFLLMVVVSTVVFTLGYLLGRSQYESQVRAAPVVSKDALRPADSALDSAKSGASPTKPQPAGPFAAPVPSDWDFYRAAEPKKAEARLEKPGKSITLAAKATASVQPTAQPAAAKSKLNLNAPLIPGGAIVLQVAALTRESDALAMAEVLQKRKFPAFVLAPGPDEFYRVQVGPYADAQSANIARRGLEKEGFKSIVKR